MTVPLNRAHLSANALLLMLCISGSSDSAEDPFDFDLSDTSANDRWQVSGYLESRNQYFVVTNDWVSNRVAGFLELKWSGDQSDNSQWRAYGSTLIQYDEQTREYRNAERSELNELYFLRDGSIFDLTIGKQRVAWGTADGVSTIDRVNAVDFREPIGNARTASRLPSWVVRNQVNLFNGILDVVWLPRGQDRKLPEFGSPWEPTYLHELRTQHRFGLINLHIDDPHKHEGGIRYAAYDEGFDWSVAYFNGYTDGPVLQTGTVNNIHFQHVRIETYNVSGALGLAKSTLRSEIAYTPNTIVSGQVSDLWQAVVGWDRTFFTNLYANIQVFYDDATGAPNSHGATFSLSNKAFDDAVTYGLRGQLANDEQSAVEVYLDYDFGDNLNSSMKYLVFDGSAGTRLFDYRDNDFLQFTFRWDF